MAAPVPSQASAQQMQQPQDTPAQAVGNQFVSQYYTVQHASPKHLHRFYSDASTITYGDVRPEGFLSKNATGQKTIHDLVMDLGYEDTSTEIYTVDSQYSLGGGVVVQVTGIMQRPAGPKRPFVQTFFLAVQEKGYYVLNDIFRYLPLVPSADNGGAPAPVPAAAAAAAPAGTTALAVPAGAIPAPPAASAAPSAPPPFAVTMPPVPAAAAAASAAMQQQQLAIQQLAMQQAAMQAGEQTNGVRGQPPPPPVAVQYTGYATVPVPGAPPILMPPPQQPAIMPVAVHPPMMPGVVPPPAGALPRGVSPPAAAPGAVAPPPRQQQQAPKPAAEGRPGEPLSYAERLRLGGGKASVPGSPARQQQQQVPAAPPAAGLTPPPATAEQPATPADATPPPAAAEGTPVRHQPPPQHSQQQAAADAIPFEEQANPSIFLRGIPASVSMAQLVQKLEQYGRLRNQGVILKTQKGRDSFAFIDFEDPAPAQALLRQGMEIESVRVDVQPKRPLIFRPAMHGGRGEGGRSGGSPNGNMGGRGGGRYDGGQPGGAGRGDRSSFRGGRGGGRGPYPGPPPVVDGRPGPMGGPMGGRGGIGPPPGAVMPTPMPMGPSMGPGRMDSRGYGPEALAYGGGACGRGYGGSSRGRGRGGPPPPEMQQQQQQQALAPPPQPID